MYETKTMSMYARIDSRITNNMLSYEDWKALDKSQLKTLDENSPSQL